MLSNEEIEARIAKFKRSVSSLLQDRLPLIGSLIERGCSYQQIASILSEDIGRPVAKCQIYDVVKRHASKDPTVERRYRLSAAINEYLSKIPKSKFGLPKNDIQQPEATAPGTPQADEKRAKLEARMQRLQAMAEVPAKTTLAKASLNVEDVWNDKL